MLCIPTALYLSPIVLLGNLTKNLGVYSSDNDENVSIFLCNSQTVKLKNNNHTSEIVLLEWWLQIAYKNKSNIYNL